MKSFFTFLYEERGGIFVLLVCLFALLLALRSVAAIFGLGRFAQPPLRARSSVGYVIVEFFTKLIDDFRHLLAMLLVLIFATALGYALWKVRDGGADEINKALQAVMATLGGLIGSIVGYYFGESAARKAQTDRSQPPGAGTLQVEPDNSPIAPVSESDNP
jgi:hypothetical protein